MSPCTAVTKYPRPRGLLCYQIPNACWSTRPRPSAHKENTRGFYFPHDLRAEILALALLSTDQVWLFTRAEALQLAQQHNAKGNRQLYWYMEPRPPRIGVTPRHAGDVEPYLLERRTSELLGMPVGPVAAVGMIDL